MIEFAQISKRYGSIEAVRAISLTVSEREVVALVGPNGAGKTTLIRMLLGLVRPTGGSARVGGHDVWRDGKAARALIGYLPQRPLLYGNLTVAENLAFVARLRDVSAGRVGEILDLVQLTPDAGRRARTLSGGMLQRLGLAQALLADPPILVLDEPTTSLDPQSTATFKELIRELHSCGKTVLLASHILSDVQELADRVAIISRGHLIAADTVAGLAARCGLPEWIEVDLPAASEAALALTASAGAEAVWRGSTLAVMIAPERKLALLEALLRGGLPIRNIRSGGPTLDTIFGRLVSESELLHVGGER